MKKMSLIFIVALALSLTPFLAQAVEIDPGNASEVTEVASDNLIDIYDEVTEVTSDNPTNIDADIGGGTPSRVPCSLRHVFYG